MGGINKKSEAGLVIILIVIIVLFFFCWLINVGQRECKSNMDCGSESYCGSGFSCHTFPNIQKTVDQYDLFWPAVAIGIAIIIAAFILKWQKTISEEIKEQQTIVKVQKEEPFEVEEVAEPYYKSENNYYKSPTNLNGP